MPDVAIAQASDFRTFVQSNGANPGSRFSYVGCLSLGDSERDLGSSEPIYCPSSTVRGKWDIIDQTITAPALGTMDFTQRMARDLSDIWYDIEERGCFLNIITPVGRCQRPDQVLQADGWIAYESVRLASLTIPGSNPLGPDDNTGLDLTGSLEWRNRYRLKKMLFESIAGSAITTEVLDGFYRDFISCGSCGENSDGCRKTYYLTRASSGSPGLSSQLVYTTDDESTFDTYDIASLGGLSASAMTAVGQYLVIISEANGGHVYASFDDIDNGISNPFSALQTNGYSVGSPRAIWSKNGELAIIVASDGYIYRMSDPAAAVQVLTDGTISVEDFNDVRGANSTWVAVGNNNTIVYSNNDGDTVALITGPEVGVNLNSVEVISANEWQVLTATGKLWYTLNQGATWTQKALPAGITVGNKIRYVNSLVGYIAAQADGVAKLLHTFTSGSEWQQTTTNTRLDKLPTAERFNFIAVCGVNRVSTGGRVSAGGDGVLATAR